MGRVAEALLEKITQLNAQLQSLHLEVYTAVNIERVDTMIAELQHEAIMVDLEAILTTIPSDSEIDPVVQAQRDELRQNIKGLQEYRDQEIASLSSHAPGDE